MLRLQNRLLQNRLSVCDQDRRSSLPLKVQTLGPALHRFHKEVLRSVKHKSFEAEIEAKMCVTRHRPKTVKNEDFQWPRPNQERLQLRERVPSITLVPRPSIEKESGQSA